MMLATLVGACATGTSHSALCTGLQQPVSDLVDIVVLEGSDAVVLSTERLVVKFDAGCRL